MTRTPTSRRSPSAQALDEDVFVARTVEASAWARDHSTLVLTTILALVVALAAVVYYQNYKEKLEDRAAGELGTIRQTALSGNKTLAIRDLETYIRRFNDTPSGKEGRILLAQAYLEQGQAPKAITTAKPLADHPDKPLGSTAAFLTAAAYEAGKDTKKAEEMYMKLSTDATMSFERRSALDNAARLRADRNDNAGAQQLYEKLVGMTPDTVPEHALYLMRLAEIKAKAGAPAPVPAGKS